MYSIVAKKNQMTFKLSLEIIKKITILYLLLINAVIWTLKEK